MFLQNLQNKRVAVVGNSLSLFDRNYGNSIDGHDIVCRINRGFVDVPEKSHGKKINLIFSSSWKTIDDLYLKHIHANDEYMHVRYVLCSPKEREIVPRVDRNMYFYYPLEMYEKLKNEKLRLSLNKRPSTGSMTLDILLECNCKSISVFGFDWKKTPTFYSINKKSHPHCFETEKKYFHNIGININQ